MAESSLFACYATDIRGYFLEDYLVLNFGKGSSITSPLNVLNRVEDILQGIRPNLIASSFFAYSSGVYTT